LTIKKGFPTYNTEHRVSFAKLRNYVSNISMVFKRPVLVGKGLSGCGWVWEWEWEWEWEWVSAWWILFYGFFLIF